MVIAETTAPVACIPDTVRPGGRWTVGLRNADGSHFDRSTAQWRLDDHHRCAQCLELTSNPVSRDDNQLLLMRMAVRPLAQPPFPLEAFGDL